MKARVVAHQCPLAAPEMRALFIKNKAIALGAGRSPAPKKIAVCEQKGLATNGTTDSANCAHVSRIRIAALRHEERWTATDELPDRSAYSRPGVHIIKMRGG